MKKLIVIALLVAALTAAFATSAFAADTPTPAAPAQGAGYGPGNAGRGIHTPGTALTGTAGQAMGMRRGAPEWAGDNETAASILGLTTAELQAERLAGKSLVQIAADKGITEDALIAKLLDARNADVAQLLADGKITQVQADYMTANMADHVKLMVERTTVGRPSFAGQSPMAGAARGGRWNR